MPGAAGLRLGTIVWITEDAGYAPSVPLGAMRAAAGSAGADRDRRDTLHATVTVGFDLAH